MKSLKCILDHAVAHRDSPFALATLVRTSGSTYRKPGARMLITPEGKTLGVLSGGCLEEIIAEDGAKVLRDGGPRLRFIDTRQYFGCEGFLEIFVEHIPAAFPDQRHVLLQIAEQISQRISPWVRTKFQHKPSDSSINLGSSLQASSSFTAEADVFIQQVPLPIRILAFGQGPEVTPLADMCNALGWELKLYSHPCECPDEIKGDTLTAALIMNHHFGRDVEAMDRILPMQLPYIGMLGPRKRGNRIISQLDPASLENPSTLDALHSPVGLDLGSESPEEIVLSIVSEVLASLSGHAAGFLRDHGEIHQDKDHEHDRLTALQAA